MRISFGGVLVTLFAGIDVVVVVSSASLDVEEQTATPSNGSIINIEDPDNIKDPDPDDDHPPTVGIRNFRPICPSSNSSTGGVGDGDDTHRSRGCAVRERLISAMESDYRLKGKMRAFDWQSYVSHSNLMYVQDFGSSADGGKNTYFRGMFTSDQR